MKVLHLTNNFPTKKLPIFGIFVKEQIESLNKLGVTNDVFFINGREKGKLEYIKSIYRIYKKLTNEKYDVIHCHHALSALCLILSGKSKQNRVMVSFQNDPVHELGSRLFTFIKRNTHGWIFKNNSSFINDEYCFYLPNGVNTNLFMPIEKAIAREKLSLNSKTNYLLFISSNHMRKQKRYDKFVATIGILKKKYNYSNIEEIVLINTTRDKIPLYFNAVDLHLLCSDFEGSPNSVKESMACNTPVVSTNVGNVKELLTDINVSFVVEENTPEELAKYVDLVLKNKNSHHNGLQRLIELQLDIDSVAVKLGVCYKKIIKK